MPAMFALGDKVIGNPIVATFAAFGSFAMLLLVDFGGPIPNRVLDQASLGVACGVLICLGTLVSQTTWLATVAMGIVAFAVLFAGAVSSVLAGATTSLLLSFILPVSLPGPASSIPDRVTGWGLAAVASLFAISLLWPSPARNPVRAAAIAACRALAERLRTEVECALSGADPAAAQAHAAATSGADEALDRLQAVFFATPYRPTGLTTDDRAVIRLVDELRWLHTIVVRSLPESGPAGQGVHVCALKKTAATVLEYAAGLLEQPRADDSELLDALEAMRGSLVEMERITTAALPVHETDEALINGVVSSLDPSFRAQELSFVVAQIATNADFFAAAARRSWLDRLLGRQPDGLPGRLTAAGERAGAQVTYDSLWLQNSLRGAAALALAVLVADLSSVEHGFWVVFGTLSVLRSSALSTGQNIVRALAGTALGFVVGGVLVYLIGTDTTVLWVLLPIAVLLAGLAPSTVSFAAGQAAFTLTLLILFNLIAPAGWKIGIVRVEDIALGGAVSLAVGVLFWPRGAVAALRRSLAQAYTESTRYLAAAVAFGLSCCDGSGPPISRPDREALGAAAASRRLDAAFRGYLAERGAKPASLADVTELVTGVTGVRLAADAVLDLWDGDGPRTGDRSTARRELATAADALTGWYREFAESLAGHDRVPVPLGPDLLLDGRLVQAVRHDLLGADGGATATGVRVIWTGDHLDAVRRLQEVLVKPARSTIST